MARATYHFPGGFLWGTATSSHQVEGQNTNNNWYRWEQQGYIQNDQKAGLACDWWGGRWQEDFDRAAESGQNAHRLSVEWSRIQPTPDRWDEQALDLYRDMVAGLVQRGMAPMVTLHHFTDPLWFYEDGGWEQPDAPRLFATYVQKVVAALKDHVNLWVTINEPNVYLYSGYLSDDFPPGKKDIPTAQQVAHNMVLGHAYAYKAIHHLQREARVGFALNYRGMAPAKPWFPPDVLMARFLSRQYNQAFINALADGKLDLLFRRQSIPEAVKTQDFVGINYYSLDLISFAPTRTGDFFLRRSYPAQAQRSETGFIANLPGGLMEALRFANRYGLPIIITENGVEDSYDSLRPRYLLEHLHQVWRATTATLPVKGFFHWTLVDNFEWERGWSQRFGLWELDVETQERTPRPSAELYAEICRSNAISAEMVERYAPEIYEKLFPV